MEENIKKGEIVIYQASSGPEIQVKLVNNSVWLTQNQIAGLFNTQRPAVTKHLNNIFKAKELNKKSVSSILEHTASDGKKYKTQFYNLDTVISVGYRVNSKKATEFRIWATRTLKSYLESGYVLNSKRLIQVENKLQELRETVDFLHKKSQHNLLIGQEQEILNLLSAYSKTLTLLEQYDNDKVNLLKQGKLGFVLTHELAKNVISKIREELIVKGESSELFAQDPEEKLNSIMGNVYQTFDGKDIYPSVEQKASHLLYFIIKDHPFIDGNKRIASFLFVYFLDKNKYLYKENGEKKINDNALTALSLLIAASDPREKDKLVRIITNLLAG